MDALPMSMFTPCFRKDFFKSKDAYAPNGVNKKQSLYWEIMQKTHEKEVKENSERE